MRRTHSSSTGRAALLPPAFVGALHIFLLPAMAKLLDLGHALVSGTLIAFSFGGLALFSHQFWSLLQHIKTLPPPVREPAAAAPAAAASSAPTLA